MELTNGYYWGATPDDLELWTFELVAAQVGANSAVQGTAQGSIYAQQGSSTYSFVFVLEIRDDADAVFYSFSTIIPDYSTFAFNLTTPQVVVPEGTYTLNFAVLLAENGNTDAVCDSDAVTVTAQPVDWFAQTYTRRLVKNAELTWFEGDQNTNISDERTKLLKAMIENFDLSDFYTKEVVDSLLLAKLNKSLQKGKIFFGDENNLPSEIYPDGLTGFVTVGVGGQYTTLQEAFAAGKFNLVQVGDVTEILGFSLTDKFVSIIGNKKYSITTSFSNAISGSLSEIVFKNVRFFNNSSISFPSSSKLNLRFYDSEITLSSVLCGGSTGNQSLFLHQTKLLLSNSIATALNCRLFGYNSSVEGTAPNSLYLYGCSNLELKGSFGEITVVTSDCSGISGTASCNDFILNTNGISVNNVVLPEVQIRNYNSSYRTSVFGSTFKSIRNTASNHIFNFIATKLIQAGNLSSIVGSKSKFTACSFGTALTIGSGVTLEKCETAGLTMAGTKNNVQGGEHTTITVNGNNNNVTGVTQATSISLGAVTGCNIVGNQVDTDIVDVLGNNIHSNITY